MKGVSPFISTAFAVLFGIVLMSAVILTLSGVQTSGIERTIQDQLTVTTREMGTEVLDVYSSLKSYQKNLENNSIVLVKEIDVSLPAEIGTNNYKIQLEEPQDILLAIVQFYIDGIAVNTTSTRPTARLVSESSNVQVENKLYNIDVGLQGITKGGLTKIRGYKYNVNGTTRDKIVLGDDSIIIGITSFQVNSSTGAECSSNKKIVVGGANIYTTGVLPETLNYKATILDTGEFTTTTSANPFSVSICTSLEDGVEGTVAMEVWDANNNRGTIRKKFLG